ncbi:MAG: CRISPR-associated protein Cas4 [Pirellulales bacterium]
MMYAESELLPISALQHLLFCERQCALIHLEQLWEENWRTVEGQHLHQKAHEGPDETREGGRIVRGLHLQSRALGLIGKADVVEFAPPPGVRSTGHIRAQLSEAIRRSTASLGELSHDERPVSYSHDGPTLADWTITPVEYKRGKPKSDDCDRVQLCAQAICLEEMLGANIPSGALFYGQRRRRSDVVFDDSLRRTTADAASRLHAMIQSRVTPRAVREKKCDSCSLVNLCLPGATRPGRSASRFVSRQFAELLTSDGPATDFPASDAP